jgi:hypothetical protein
MSCMTRTTKDLIDDLDAAVTGQGVSGDRTQTALVVGFDLECRMIFQDESDRLQKLNTLVSNGGIPLGFIKVVRVGDDLQFFSRPQTIFEKKSEDPQNFKRALHDGRKDDGFRRGGILTTFPSSGSPPGDSVYAGSTRMHPVLQRKTRVGIRMPPVRLPHPVSQDHSPDPVNKIFTCLY